MDALARLAPVALQLLHRVDEILARAGAPADHRVWPLLRRLRTLPGEAVSELAATSPGPLAAAVDTLSALAEEYTRLHATLPPEPGWRGAGGASFAIRWQSLTAHLDGDLADRVRATASFLHAVRDWQAEARGSVAQALAAALGSAEAVLVHTAADPVRAAPAAADIAALVLEALLHAYERGERVLGEGGPRLAELSYRAPVPVGAADREATTEVNL